MIRHFFWCTTSLWNYLSLHCNFSKKWNFNRSNKHFRLISFPKWFFFKMNLCVLGGNQVVIYLLVWGFRWVKFRAPNLWMGEKIRPLTPTGAWNKVNVGFYFHGHPTNWKRNQPEHRFGLNCQHPYDILDYPSATLDNYLAPSDQCIKDLF